MVSSADSFYALTSLLQPVRQAWYQAARMALAKSDVSVSVAAPVLMVSRLGDGVLQQVLAENIGVHPAALVRTLDQAEQANLLERRAVSGNRRKKGIYLLPEGRTLAEKMERSLRTLRKTLLSDLPLADIDIAIRVLQALEDRARLYSEAQRANDRQQA